MALASQVFFNLLKETLGVEPVERLPKDALGVGPRAQRDPRDGTVKLDSKILEEAREAVPEVELFDDSRDAAEAVVQLREFEAKHLQRVQKRRGGAPPLPGHGSVGLAWSRDASHLTELMSLERNVSGGPSQYTSRRYLMSHFKHLQLSNMSVAALDGGFEALVGLEELRISGNKLQVLEHLPRNVRSVSAYCNKLSAVRQRPALKSCLHLGLGYNLLDDSQMRSVASAAPGMAVLDLAANHLCSLQGVLRSVSGLRKLQHLILHSNPCALTYGYRAAVLDSLPNLSTLDDFPIDREDADQHPLEALDSSSRAPAPGEQIVVAVSVPSVSGLVLSTDVLPEPAAPPEPAKGKPAPKGKKGKQAEAEEPPPSPPPQSSFFVHVVLPTDCLHVSAHAGELAETMPMDPNAVPHRVPPTVEFRDGVLSSKAQVMLFEQPVLPAKAEHGDTEGGSEGAAGGEGKGEEEEKGEGEGEGEGQEDGKEANSPLEPILLAKGELDISALAAPTADSKVALSVDCSLKVVELPSAVLEAIAKSESAKIIKAAAESAEADEPAKAPPKKGAKGGKGAAAEEVDVSRPLTPEEQELHQKKCAETRSTLKSTCTPQALIQVSLLLSGPIPLSAEETALEAAETKDAEGDDGGAGAGAGGSA